MKRSRHILLVAFVATALAADHVAAAGAPQEKPRETQSVGRRLAGRLVITFRQSVPSMACRPLRQELSRGTVVRAEQAARVEVELPPAPFEASPSGYPLPPPLA